MPGLPLLLAEDMQRLDSAADELLRRSEASTVLIIDKGGPMLTQRGETAQFDLTTIAALAAGSFCATQAIAERMGETTFSHIYQQGEGHSLLCSNIDDNTLLLVIFPATTGVGAVKFYAASTVEQVGRQLCEAALRAPGTCADLVAMDTVDASNIFRKATAA